MSEIFEIFNRLQLNLESILEMDPLVHQKMITHLRDSHIEILTLINDWETGGTTDQNNKGFHAMIINQPTNSQNKTPNCSCRQTYSF